MPIYEAICDKCGETDDVYVAAGTPGLPACDRCSGPLRRGALGTFAIRTPAPTGMKMADGTFVRGTFGPPPRRVRRRIKTF